MTRREFKEFRQQVIDECFSILDDKGAAYAGDDDVLENFKRFGDRFKMHHEKVARLYLAKHEDSRDSYISNRVQTVEGIASTMRDIINYNLLLFAAFKEEQQTFAEVLEDVRQDVEGF